MATEGPGGRAHTAMVYDSARKRMVLFGGLTEGYAVPGQMWTWDGNAWTTLTSVGPPRRTHHRMAFHGDAGVVVLFGGSSNGRPAEALADT